MAPVVVAVMATRAAGLTSSLGTTATRRKIRPLQGIGAVTGAGDTAKSLLIYRLKRSVKRFLSDADTVGSCLVKNSMAAGETPGTFPALR
jgi:hypothetical protein